MHPFVDLSAYQDGALDEPRRAEVAAHLAGCSVCPGRLAQLRATASLIRRLPSPAPSRSLVPRLAAPFWIAPLRTLSAVASGLAVLAFAATTLIASAPAATSAGGAPAAAPASAASNLERTDSSSPSSSFGVGPAASGQPLAPAAPAAQPSSSAQTSDATKRSAQGQGAATPTPVAKGETTPEGRARDAVAQSEPIRREVASPWLWLAVAILFGALALALQRRLRTR